MTEDSGDKAAEKRKWGVGGTKRGGRGLKGNAVQKTGRPNAQEVSRTKTGIGEWTEGHLKTVMSKIREQQKHLIEGKKERVRFLTDGPSCPGGRKQSRWQELTSRTVRCDRQGIGTIKPGRATPRRAPRAVMRGETPAVNARQGERGKTLTEEGFARHH